MGKTSSAVKNKYNAKAYDRINLTMPKGKRKLFKITLKSAEKAPMLLSIVLSTKPCNVILSLILKTAPRGLFLFPSSVPSFPFWYCVPK